MKNYWNPEDWDDWDDDDIGFEEWEVVGCGKVNRF